jgi:hypothetical protein
MCSISLEFVTIIDEELGAITGRRHEFTRMFCMRGIVRRKECSIPVKVGNTKCRLTDRYGNISSPFDALIYCAYTNDVPIIMGVKDMLDRFDLSICVRDKKGKMREIGRGE